MAPAPLQLPLTPEQALAAWPAHVPLAALFSGEADTARARWVTLAAPSRSVSIDNISALASAPFLSNPLPSTKPDDPDLPPFTKGWIGSISYDCGRTLEPRAASTRSAAATSNLAPQASWPLMHWARCNDALIYDRQLRAWWGIGDHSHLTRSLAHRPAPTPAPQLGELQSLWGREGYTDAVRRVIEYIRAGDVYQVNLAHHLQASFSGSARAFFAHTIARARPWYGAYLELENLALLSFSPESFLDIDPTTRRITTRPMKGTRPASADPAELRAAEKDRAELNMIIDLMRNDLGRLCQFGSIRVEAPRDIESHSSSVLQATATISGTLRPHASILDILRATFPGGSVTGAPKIRAMQIIDELEPHPRGPYCGAIGFISDSGHASFNIAIRTALIHGRPVVTDPGTLHPSHALDRFEDATLTFPVGAGIVADSDPDSEWQETLLKAQLLSPTQNDARIR